MTTPENMETSDENMSGVRRTFRKLRILIKGMTVEPLMLLDGLAFSNMHVYMENLQMERVCEVTCGYEEDVCMNLKLHPDESVQVQKNYSVLALYNGIIAAALPLFFILFMGAWSDKYGRKIPLVATQFGHCLHAGGYLLASLAPGWPAEALLLVTLLDTLGGGAVSFLTAANSYISDVSSEDSRTSRVGLANSIWFLGGPMGTLLGTYIYKWGGYLPLFATSLSFSAMGLLYVIFCLPESHGPFAKKSKHLAEKMKLDLRESVAKVYGIEKKSNTQKKSLKINPATQIHLQNSLNSQTNTANVPLSIETLPQKYPQTPQNSENSLQPKLSTFSTTSISSTPSISTMIKDFFHPRRIYDSFRTTLRVREGNTRALILILISTSLLRRLTRSPYVFAFTRHELHWHATDYSLWVTYKNLMATTGSLVAVPLLSGRLGVADNLLAMIGATSGILEYVLYGFVSQKTPNLIWIGPIAALLLNSCTIAQRSMMTKFVTTDEIGKVSAVLGALDGMMPMVNSALFTAVYHASVSTFPAAHFFLGASSSGLMIVLFCVLMRMGRSGQYDVESAKPSQNQSKNSPIVNKSLVMHTDSIWVASDALALAIATPNIHTIQLQQEALKNPGTDSWSRKIIVRIKSLLGVIFKSDLKVSHNETDPKLGISSLFLNVNHIVTETVMSKSNCEELGQNEVKTEILTQNQVKSEIKSDILGHNEIKSEILPPV